MTDPPTQERIPEQGEAGLKEKLEYHLDLQQKQENILKAMISQGYTSKKVQIRADLALTTARISILRDSLTYVRDGISNLQVSPGTAQPTANERLAELQVQANSMLT